MLVVGLTGDVGAGKSTVARVWQECGAFLLDADFLAKREWSKPTILKQAVARWGKEILNADGGPDLRAIAKRGFENEDGYRFLCGLIHPGVMAELEREVCRGGGWVVVEIPLLFEVGVPWWVDATVFVSASFEARLERNTPRGLDAEELKRRERWLLSRDEKRKRADYEISNEGSLESLSEEAQKLGAKMKRLAEVAEGEIVFSSKEKGMKMQTLLLTSGLVAFVQTAPTSSGFAFKFKTLFPLFPRIRLLLEEGCPEGGGFLFCRELRHSTLNALKAVEEACGV